MIDPVSGSRKRVEQGVWRNALEARGRAGQRGRELDRGEGQAREEGQAPTWVVHYGILGVTLCLP